MSVIEAADLRKVCTGRPAVDGFSFTVEEGGIFGTLGPNGAGRTTAVVCVEGLRVPDSGRVRVTASDPVAEARGHPPRARRAARTRTRGAGPGSPRARPAARSPANCSAEKRP